MLFDTASPFYQDDAGPSPFYQDKVEDPVKLSYMGVFNEEASFKGPSPHEPRFYRVVLGTLFVKPFEDPQAEKILKVNMAPGTTVTTTGNLWRGKHGNVWAELDRKYQEWRWVCVLGPGFGMASPLLAPEEEYGLIIGAPRRRIPRRKVQKEEKPVDEEPDDELPDDFESAEPTGSEVHFQVVATSIAIRKAPCTRAPSLGGLGKDKILFGKPYSFSDNPWLRIDSEECKKLFLDSTTCDGWVLIHGSCLGMGQLLRKLSPEEETEQMELRKAAAAAALEAERKALESERKAIELARQEAKAQAALPDAAQAAVGALVEANIADSNTVAFFEVVSNDPALARSEPSTSAASLGSLARGKIISGTVRTVEGSSWVCLAEAECKRLLIKGAEGWVLVHSAPAGLHLRMLTKEEERTYLHAQNEIEKERAHMEAVKREAEEQRQALQREKAEFEAKKQAAEQAAAAAAIAAAAAASASAEAALSAQVAGIAPAPAAAAAPTQPAGREQSAPAAAAPAAVEGLAAPPAPKVARPPGDVKSWGVDEVITFIESLELWKYAEKFRENAVDGEYLLELSEADLIEEVGLPKLSARKIIKKRDQP